MKRTFAAAILATALLMGAAPPSKAPSGFDLTPDRVRFDLQGLAKSARGELTIPLPPRPTSASTWATTSSRTTSPRRTGRS